MAPGGEVSIGPVGIGALSADGSTAPAAPAKSEREIALEAEVAQSRREAAEAEIREADAVCVAAGVPLGHDNKAEVLKLFEAGNKSAARAMLKLAADSARQVASVKGDANLKALTQPEASGEELAHRRNRVENLRAAGYTVECDAEYNITKQISPRERNGAQRG